MNGLARDTLVASFGLDAFWVGPFEETLMELGARAAYYEVEENDGWAWWLPWQSLDDPIHIGFCRICGCSDLDACVDDLEGPCWWVAADLCSHCAFKTKAVPA